MKQSHSHQIYPTGVLIPAIILDMTLGSLCAQDLAQGRSLAELVKGGWRADEREVTRIAKELLNILDYLASRRPAVTHR